jgi:protein phosphatase
MTEEFSNEDLHSNERIESTSSSNGSLNADERSSQGAGSLDSVPFDQPPGELFDSAAHTFRAEPPPIRIEVAALTDIGCVRMNNEDSLGYDESSGIFVVCDGMGGAASGEIASSRAVAAILKCFGDSASSDIPVNARLLDAINIANLDVWEHAQVPENKGMGTTVVVAALDGDKLIIGNMGDSRAYVIRDGKCVQVSVDHSLVNELVRNGTLTPEGARKSEIPGLASVVTRAVGIAAVAQPDFFSVDFESGTAVLLATDGLTRYFSDEELAAILVESSFESCCADLISTAKQRGGEDNITCILIRSWPA